MAEVVVPAQMDGSAAGTVCASRGMLTFMLEHETFYATNPPRSAPWKCAPTHCCFRRPEIPDRSAPAFHFPTGPQSVYGDATRFVLELRDGDGRILIALEFGQRAERKDVAQTQMILRPSEHRAWSEKVRRAEVIRTSGRACSIHHTRVTSKSSKIVSFDTNAIFSSRACATSIRSNGSRCAPPSEPATCACSSVMCSG